MLVYDDGHQVTTSNPDFVQGFREMFTDGWALPYASSAHSLTRVFVAEPDGTKTYLFRREV